MPKRLCIILFLICQFAYSQKIIHKTILHPDITFIGIDANNCFEINIATSNSDELVVEAKIDGEYTKDLLLTVKEEGSAILIGAGFPPTFVAPNDKLSAHKVVSIALFIVLPQHKSVDLYGTSCNISIMGNYENLKVTLNDGRCQLDNVSGSVEVLSLSGDIWASSAQADITATSKFGSVQEDDIPGGLNKYVLSSTTGNIHLTKTE